jgi:hypothetical protein
VTRYRIANHRVTGEIALQRGDGDGALAAFAEAARLEPRIALRSYQARALRLVRPAAADTANAQRLISRWRYLMWLDPVTEEPGSVGDALRWLARNHVAPDAAKQQ